VGPRARLHRAKWDKRMTWRKSTASGGNGCVEVSLPEWHKSSRSSDGACVEVAQADGAVLVRDTDDPTVVIKVRRESWVAFTQGVKSGEFDLEGNHGS
jgi:hypothetical protein